MDEQYRKAAEVIYVQMRTMHDHAAKLQGEYGRWLVNSLLLLHGATIAGLLFKASSGGGPPSYLTSIWWFVFGIVFALATGFCAWWNFTFAMQAYQKMADVRMLTDRQFWPTADSKIGLKVNATLWIANVTGVLSVLCLISGAFAIWCSWR